MTGTDVLGSKNKIKNIKSQWMNYKIKNKLLWSNSEHFNMNHFHILQLLLYVSVKKQIFICKVDKRIFQRKHGVKCKNCYSRKTIKPVANFNKTNAKDKTNKTVAKCSNINTKAKSSKTCRSACLCYLSLTKFKAKTRRKNTRLCLYF